MRRALDAEHQRIVGVADLVPVLLAGDGVGAGRQHLVDRVEAAAEQSGLRAFAVERNAEREHLAGLDQAGGLGDVLGSHVVERADVVILAPTAPVRQLLGGLLDRLLADFDVHCVLLNSTVALRLSPAGADCGSPHTIRLSTEWLTPAAVRGMSGAQTLPSARKNLSGVN